MKTEKLPLVRVSGREHVAEIELALPPLNLVTRELLVDLHEAINRLEDDRNVRCVVLHQGAARAFSAGSNMHEFQEVATKAPEAKILYEEFVVRRLAQLRCPTIAALDGAALGGGLELALACDLRVAKRGVRIGLTECRIGGLGGSGAIRLTRLVGPGRASEMLYLGKIVDADAAYGWGLVNVVVDEGSARERAIVLAQEISANGPLSNAYAKRLVSAALDEPIGAALARANELQEQIFRSSDLMQSARAFLEKRPINFEGL